MIYTPNPILLTIMTQDEPEPEYLIAELAKRMVDYTLELDGKLDAYRAEQENARLAAEAEAERAEEEARLAEEAAAAVTEEPVSPMPETVPTEEPRPVQTESPASALDPLTVLHDPININGENQRSRLFVLAGAILVLAAVMLIGMSRRSRR